MRGQSAEDIGGPEVGVYQLASGVAHQRGQVSDSVGPQADQIQIGHLNGMAGVGGGHAALPVTSHDHLVSCPVQPL